MLRPNKHTIHMNMKNEQQNKMFVVLCVYGSAPIVNKTIQVLNTHPTENGFSHTNGVFEVKKKKGDFRNSAVRRSQEDERKFRFWYRLRANQNGLPKSSIILDRRLRYSCVYVCSKHVFVDEYCWDSIQYLLLETNLMKSTEDLNEPEIIGLVTHTHKHFIEGKN